jgi:hypothetical protein
MSYPVIPCAHCNQPGHKANRCKELGIPPDGEIIKPLPGQNDVDDCDDSIIITGHKNLFLWCEDDECHMNIKLYKNKQNRKRYLKYTKRFKRNLFRTLISASNLKVNTSRPIGVFR